MSGSCVQAFSSKLNELLCEVCKSEFDDGEMRVHLIELETSQCAVDITDATGVSQTHMVPAHRHLALHVNKNCYALYQSRKLHAFVESTRDVLRTNMRNERSLADRHQPLFSRYRHYHGINSVKELTIHPALQETSEAQPSVAWRVRVAADCPLPVLDKTEWMWQQLALFFDRLTECDVRVELGANSAANGSFEVSEKFRAELQSKKPFESLGVLHRVHVWAQTLEQTDRLLRMRFVVWHSASTSAVQRLFDRFQCERGVSFADLVARGGTSASTFAVSFRELLRDIDKDVHEVIRHALSEERKWPEPLCAYNARIAWSRPLDTRASEVEFMPRAQIDEDHYSVRMNLQPAPAKTDYYMVAWEADRPVLVHMHGLCDDPGIPVVITHNKERVVTDLHDSSFIRHVDDSRITRIV